eukprot:7307796-Karenia_brevis.AAC.2
MAALKLITYELLNAVCNSPQNCGACCRRTSSTLTKMAALKLITLCSKPALHIDSGFINAQRLCAIFPHADMAALKLITCGLASAVCSASPHCHGRPVAHPKMAALKLITLCSKPALHVDPVTNAQ